MEELRSSWEAVRNQFQLAPEYIHLGTSQYLSSHPAIVRNAIEAWRRALDHNPVVCLQEDGDRCMEALRKAAAEYMNCGKDDVAFTHSTTMGLGLVYGGMNIGEEDEILVTKHEHYAHRESVNLVSDRKNARVNEISLYRDIHTVTADELTESVRKNISGRTRVVSLTWVHSGTGLKIPVKRIAEIIAEENKVRDEKHQIIFCVDGVHGFGIEEETLDALGCDFFVTGGHKWLFGPRGTGLIYGRKNSWRYTLPIIPDFSEVMSAEVDEKSERPPRMNGRQATPGGFQAFEHRWALKEAFDFHQLIGRKRIRERVHELNRYCKEALRSLPHVTVYTPEEEKLSAGIVAFDVKGYTSRQTSDYLLKRKIIATTAPYNPPTTRFTPGIYNSYAEIDRAAEVIAGMR
jgi:isopenicillin-N epimerase